MATEVKKPTTLYREGDHSPPVRAAKNADMRRYRREIAEAVFGPEVRARVLDQVRSGTRLSEAAAQANVSAMLVHGRARWDPEFARLLDKALEAYSRPFMGEYCGTPTGYRSGCRCRECRAAHTEDAARRRAGGA